MNRDFSFRIDTTIETLPRLPDKDAMILLNHKLRITIFIVSAVAFFSSTGCTPRPDRKAEPQPVVVSGSLDSVDWQSLIGSELIVEGDLIVVDTFDLVRRGQVKVARDRLYIPTSQIDPNDADAAGTAFDGGSNVAKVNEAQKHNDSATITLDDDSDEQNSFPPKLFPNLGSTHQTVRVGSVIHGVSGLVTENGNGPVLLVKGPLRCTFAQRPERPSLEDADITVASFNVLNYFTTIDDGKNNARGADTALEFERQEAKLVSAINGLQADVIGLMELENNNDAETRLIAALNKEIGDDVFVGCGIPNEFRTAPGGDDAIRVGIIYRADRVSPLKSVAAIRDDAFELARTPIVQTFVPNEKGKPFTLIVNHFKSKGGANEAGVSDKNRGDGQAAFNSTRRSQALAICRYIDSLEDRIQPRVLVIGDLNAYQQEDPIDALRAKGLVDLSEIFAQGASSDSGRTHYSYVYYGQCGSLDHAFATPSLATDVTGIATWHINADEPRFVDYNQEFNPSVLFEANPYRSSDHDPVLIGVRK